LVRDHKSVERILPELRPREPSYFEEFCDVCQSTDYGAKESGSTEDVILQVRCFRR
jgi:hypothetical protein